MTRPPSLLWKIGSAGAAGLLLAFLALPVAALFVTLGWSEFKAGMSSPGVGAALALSVKTTLAALAIVVVLGTPLSWELSRREGAIARLVETLVRLPAVLPPAVAGVALLLAFGRVGLLGPGLDAIGVHVPFTTLAVVLAQVFVAAPFYVATASAAFRDLDDRQLEVARTLGASPARVFFRIAVPLARPGLLAGAAMAWARALGEFGATLMFAGNLSGTTQTLPLAVYTAFESDLRAAQSLSIVLVVVAFVLLFVIATKLGRGIELRR